MTSSVVWSGATGTADIAVANLSTTLTIPVIGGLTANAVLVVVVASHTHGPTDPTLGVLTANWQPTGWLNEDLILPFGGSTHGVFATGLSRDTYYGGGHALDGSVRLDLGGVLTLNCNVLTDLGGGHFSVTDPADVTLACAAIIVDGDLASAINPGVNSAAQDVSLDFNSVVSNAIAWSYSPPIGTWTVAGSPLVGVFAAAGNASVSLTDVAWTTVAGTVFTQSKAGGSTAEDVHVEIATAPSLGPGVGQPIDYTLGANEFWDIQGTVLGFRDFAVVRRSRTWSFVIGL